MKSQTVKHSWIIPGIILLVALAMRLVGSDFSFSNDELSAIKRLQFDSLGAIISQGVILDGHPAFTHLFLYGWEKLAGYKEWLFRLPFILAGTWAVYLSFKIGERWKHRTAGLLAASAMAFLCFPIMYSQWARPYAFGLAFTLWFALRWTILLKAEKPAFKHLLWMGIAGALCMYTHYFSGLTALMIGLGGLFLLNKTNWKWYLGGAVLAVVLFLPHIGITMHHLEVGGVGGPQGWLGTPEKDFLGGFFQLAFSSSWWVLGGCLLFAASGFAFGFKQQQVNKYQLVALFTFVGVYLTGWIYSTYNNPVLQPSVLLFAFPFVLIALFSLVPDIQQKTIGKVTVVLFLVVGSLFTVFGNRYYEKNHFGVFKELAEKMQEWDKTYEGNITFAVNVNHASYIDYYFDELDFHPELLSVRMEEYEALDSLLQQLPDLETDFFAFGWSTQSTFPETYDGIRNLYPEVVEDNVWFNARITLFKLGPPRLDSTLFTSKFNLEGRGFTTGWHPPNNDLRMLTDEHPTTTCIDATSSYGVKYVMTDSLLKLYKGKMVRFSTEELGADPGYSLMVYSYMRGDSTLDWHATRTSMFSSAFAPPTVSVMRKLPGEIQEGDEVHLFVWHQEGGKLCYRNAQVTILDHPGFFNRIQSF